MVRLIISIYYCRYTNRTPKQPKARTVPLRCAPWCSYPAVVVTGIWLRWWTGCLASCFRDPFLSLISCIGQSTLSPRLSINWTGSLQSEFEYRHTYSGLIPGLHPANERQRYFVTTSLIGWVQASTQPCYRAISSGKTARCLIHVYFNYLDDCVSQVCCKIWIRKKTVMSNEKCRRLNLWGRSRTYLFHAFIIVPN